MVQERKTQGFGIHAYGCRVQVETACHEAYCVLTRYVLPSLPKKPSVDCPDMRIRIDRAVDEFRLLIDDVPVDSANQAISLVPSLIRALDDAVLEHMTTLRALHAGVVIWNGRALLLPGASHAGKSSLVAEFLRRGASYFSDEYALMDADGRVHPYPRPLLVRNGGPEQHPMLAGEYNAPVGDAPARVGWVFELQYRPEERFSTAPITQSEALLALLRNTPHALEETPDMVDTLRCAITEAACYSGCRGEAAQAVDEILRLIDGQSA